MALARPAPSWLGEPSAPKNPSALLDELLATIFLGVLDAGEWAFPRFIRSRIVRAVAGGLTVGAIAIWLPHVYGNGFETTVRMLDAWTGRVLHTTVVGRNPRRSVVTRGPIMRPRPWSSRRAMLRLTMPTSQRPTLSTVVVNSRTGRSCTIEPSGYRWCWTP